MSARPAFDREAVPLNQRPDETLHVSVVVSSDSATSVPTTHLRERFAFRTAAECRSYDAAVRVWLAAMPTPESVREALLKPAPPPPRRRVSAARRLGEILDLGDLEQPAPLPVAWPYDQEADR